MEVTKRKREEQGWECRNGLTPLVLITFSFGRRIAIIANHFCRFVASFAFGESADKELLPGHALILSQSADRFPGC